MTAPERFLTCMVTLVFVAGVGALIVGPNHPDRPLRPLRSGVVDRCGRPVLDRNGDPVIVQFQRKPPITPPAPSRTGPPPSAPAAVETVTTTLVPADIRPSSEVSPLSRPARAPVALDHRTPLPAHHGGLVRSYRL